MESPLVPTLRNQLIQMAEEADEAVAILEPDGTFAYTNRAFERLHGYDPGTLVGRHATAISSAEDPDAEVGPILAQAREQGRWEGRVHNRTCGGMAFTSYVWLTAIAARDGAIHSIVETKYPVSPDQTPPDSVRRAHNRLAHTEDLVPGVLYVCRNDPQWTMKWVSGAVEGLTGYVSEALIDNREVAYGDLVHPEDQTRVWHEIQRQLATSGVFEVRYRLRGRDGREIPVWERGRRNGDDADGTELLEGYIVESDSSDASIAQLRETEDRYQRLFENLVDGAGVHLIREDGQSGRFVAVNQVLARLLGYSHQQLLSLSPRDVGKENSAQADAERVAQVLRGEPLAFEGQLVARDGTLLPVEVRANSFRWGERTAILAQYRDLRERKAQERLLRRSNRALEMLSHINRLIVRTDKGPDTLLQKALEGMQAVTELPLVWAGFVAWDDEGGQRLEGLVARGEEADSVGEAALTTALREGQAASAVAAAYSTAQPAVADLTVPASSDDWWHSLQQAGLGSMLVLPLNGEKRPGVIGLASSDPEAFDYTGEQEVLAEIAEDIGFGLSAEQVRWDLEQETARREELLEATIHSMASLLEEKDPYTAGHQERVGELAVAIAHRLGLSENRIAGLQLGAWVHDIGKIRVPTDILNKPGKLSANEFALIQEHTEAGGRILSNVDFPWPIHDMVRHHHERLDGSGYPDGLKGEDLSTEVCIMAVADMVEAITSHRPYRPGLGIDKALAILREERATKLDPEAVDACLALFEEEGFTWTESGG